MHHRKPNTNYAQYVMFWDRLMRTYVEYESGVKQAGQARQAGAPSPPQGQAPSVAQGRGEAQGGSGRGAEGAARPGAAEADRLPAWADAAVEAATGRVVESR